MGAPERFGGPRWHGLRSGSAPTEASPCGWCGGWVAPVRGHASGDVQRRAERQNLARADDFKRMVDLAGQRWPDGWVKGEGFLRPASEPDPLRRPPTFVELGEEYVRQIVDLSPGQRKRYLGQLKVLAEAEIRGAHCSPADHRDGRRGPEGVADRLGPRVEDQVELPRPGPRRLRLRRQAGLDGGQPSRGDGAEAVEGQAVPSRAAVPHREGARGRRTPRRQARRPALRRGRAPGCGSARSPRCGSGTSTSSAAPSGSTRRGSATARTARPRPRAGWPSRLKPKHAMRDHHLGNPKTPRSRRTITIAPDGRRRSWRSGSRAGLPTTSSSPPARVGRCTTATSTPTSGAS